MRATPERPYVYDCPGLDRLAQLAGLTGEANDGYPDGGATKNADAPSRCEAV